ncbi:MAG: ferredoxin [Acidobacteriota bacterium]|jgi:ferredoxin
MADLNRKLANNAPGRYYVDDQCIDCDVCRDTSPSNFKREDSGAFSFVFQQPRNESEELLCRTAMDACPVEAIGDDSR